MQTEAAAPTALAPAKVNLCLHVTGRRADGYHLLDSIVVFAGTGDRLSVTPAAGLTLRLSGPFAAAVPEGDDNLVLRAARLVRPAGAGAALVLDKRLPAASGIGGGSSDAAAALRLLARLWGVALPDAATAAALGADLPVCLAAAPARMTGIGGGLSPLPALPACWLVLANPGIAVPTGAVFAGLERRDGAPLPDRLPPWPDAAALAAFLGQTRNDLAPAAEALAPPVAEVRAALAAQPGCLIARMSGSGATSFGLFARPGEAAAAAAALRRARPGWWVADAPVLDAPPGQPDAG